MSQKDAVENFLNKEASPEDVNHSFARRARKLKPPQSYIDKMGFLGKHSLLNCFANEKDLILTQENLAIFYGMVSEADQLFNDQNNEHVKVLAEVFRGTFQQEPSGLEEVLDSPNWKSYGFQTGKAGSDFRGGGVLALKALKYMAEYEPALVSDAKEFMKGCDSYLHACVVITVVFELKNYLHFGIYSAYHESFDLEKACSRRCLKFMLDLENCQHVEQYVKIFFKLAVAVTRRIMGFWKKSCELDSRVKIVDFKQAETIVFRMVKGIMELEAEKKRVPSYKMDKLVDQIMCAKISDKISPMILK